MDELTRMLAAEQLRELTEAIDTGERWFTVKRIENMMALKIALAKSLRDVPDGS